MTVLGLDGVSISSIAVLVITAFIAGLARPGAAFPASVRH